MSSSTLKDEDLVPICPFVQKLLAILGDPKNFNIETEKKFVRWSDNGDRIIIEVENFKKYLMTKYFHHATENFG